jgi:hypothetical protein
VNGITKSSLFEKYTGSMGALQILTIAKLHETQVFIGGGILKIWEWNERN